MIATQNQPVTNENLLLANITDVNPFAYENADEETPAATLLPGRIMTHQPKAGLNPVVDAAGYLFSVLGKLKLLKQYRQLNKLQKELIVELNTFQDAIKTHGYNAEYLMVCRYILCATFDDIIYNTNWGGQGQWDIHSLLLAFNQDPQHHDKFFSILERALKEPAHYIDLMELIYLSLSFGYKGKYRATEHSQYQLEQIINNLYKHIRAFRGSFNKTLSPHAPKHTKKSNKLLSRPKTSLTFVFLATACLIMVIFVGLGYLMDVISNEANSSIQSIENLVVKQPHSQ